jgi:hypothetical protein
VDAALAATVTNPLYLTGTKTIAMTPSTTSYDYISLESPASSASGVITVTDGVQDFTYVTVYIKAGVQPQIGDMLYDGSLIYRIADTAMFSNTRYVLKLTNPYKSVSNTLSYLYSAYTATVKMSPINSGNPGVTKKYTEFQASFRNSDACSGCDVSFSTNIVGASDTTHWNARVGTDGNTISFNSFGHSPWGQFSWSEGITTARIYGTSPNVTMRIYVPRQATLATWIQPTITHIVAGEPWSLQSITLITGQGSSRTTR